MSQATETSDFKIGDVVQLKSGGILMTVMAVKHGNADKITCTWTEYGQMFDGVRPASIGQQSFPTQILKRAGPGK